MILSQVGLEGTANRRLAIIGEKEMPIDNVLSMHYKMQMILHYYQLANVYPPIYMGYGVWAVQSD